LIANQRFTLLVSLLALLAAGCSSTVTMEMPTIPEPHMAKIPVDVAVRIPAQFQDFTHEENVLGKEAWTIKLGSANAIFFTQLFGYMFDNVVVLGPDDDARNYQFDALIEPSIEGFEFSVPSQSKTETFAVWIRYRMQIYDSIGNNAANWTVSAYGKSQKEGLGGSDSLRRAAILAMRDAAALIIMQLDKVTKISALADGPLATPEETMAAGDAPDLDDADLDEPIDYGIFAIGGIADETN